MQSIARPCHFPRLQLKVSQPVFLRCVVSVELKLGVPIGMSGVLFRKEVFAARRGEWLGTIRLQAPRLGWILLGTGFAVVAAALVLLFCGHYTRHEQVMGTLVPRSGLLSLAPATAGIVTRVRVREGDPVRAGDPLVEISSEQASTSMGDTDATIARQLQLKHDRLTADLGDLSRLGAMQGDEMRARLALLDSQMTQLKQQIDLQQQRADSAEALLEQWSGLSHTGVVTKLQLLQQRDTTLQNQSQVKELRAQHLQLQQQARQLRGQIDQLPATLSGKRNDTERQLADVTQSMAQNAVKRGVVLRAPTDGVVANVLVHSGQPVSADQALMAVLPADAPLLAELWVPTRSVGFIRPGVPVVLRYQAYPYQKFGQRVGRVQDVSRSAVSAKEVSRLLGQEITEPRYRVEVVLDSQSIMAYGRSESLRPGMTLDADILLDRRRLIEWVLEPVYGLMRNGASSAHAPLAGGIHG
ncbi:hypothetical protein KCV01_g21076, partial [Aureobasidium melanogenum]